MNSIIDTHLHLWDLKRFNLPWLAGIDALNHSFSLDDYQQACGDHHIDKAVYMEVDVTKKQKLDEAIYSVELSKDKNTLVAGSICSGVLGKPRFDDYLETYAQHSEIKGVRHVLHVPDYEKGYCLQDAFLRDLEKLFSHGLLFDICIRPAELDDALQLVDIFPDGTFVIDHCGNANPLLVAGKIPQLPQDEADIFWHDKDAWQEQMAALGQRSNTICKISGIIARVNPVSFQVDDLQPVVKHCLDNFADDRVVVGGDWPVCELTMGLDCWWTALKEIVDGEPQQLKDKLFFKNAKRIYKL